VFNLVGKRYIFLIISLMVIVPGAISLIVKGLNLGLDFVGGANVELRPQTAITTTEMTNLLKPFNLQDLQVLTGTRTELPGNQVTWVRLNTQIDTNVQNSIKTTIVNKYQSSVTANSQVNVSFNDLTLANGQTVTVAIISTPGVAPKIADIESLLSKIPNTTNPNAPASTATPTASPTAATTPTASATKTPTPAATAKATATAKGTPTPAPTATATPTSNPANIKVNVINVAQGTTPQTITILTRSVISQAELLKIQAGILNGNNNYVEVLQNSTVSGSVAAETTRNSFLAVVAASVFILLYIWFSFRKVAKPWRYGACAIIALLHDVLVVLGVFSILGWLFNVQVDSLFITALLTVVGFSVHDTIVVFDRIRENMQRRTSESFEQIVNASLVQTMARSLNTSLTVLLTLSALTLFGGTSIRTFTLALLIGIFSGTYSSIFNASMLLVIWEKGELFFGRFNRERTPDGREVRELVRSGR
jgi:preprotein translocase SecF subunit